MCDKDSKLSTTHNLCNNLVRITILSVRLTLIFLGDLGKMAKFSDYVMAEAFLFCPRILVEYVQGT